MNESYLIKDIIATYRKHGWQLQRVLIRSETRAEVIDKEESILEGAEVNQSEVDALWFSRPSPGLREAWELRLVAEQPYALFAAFESDETEEDREEARLEMEHQMRDEVSEPPAVAGGPNALEEQ